jgi:hypothetical protein
VYYPTDMQDQHNQVRMRKIQPIHGSSSFVLVIPKEFVADLKISSEDYVKCTLVGDSLVVKKADI